MRIPRPVPLPQDVATLREAAKLLAMSAVKNEQQADEYLNAARKCFNLSDEMLGQR
jgi:adenylate cyclase class IV